MIGSILRALSLLAAGALIGGCVTANVDEMVFNEPVEGIGDSSVAILGRRHASDYDTEPDFVRCVGKYIRARDKSIKVIDELEFLNSLYPWFEPRTAPLHAPDLSDLLKQEAVANKVSELKLAYLIWIDGTTVRSETVGSMACGVSLSGAGCFGFGTWTDDASYEATIWDFRDQTQMGQVSTTAKGQSYMPALVVPIPIVAPVQDTACDSIARQLLEYFSADY